MPKILYVAKKFGKTALDMIAKCNAIIAEYTALGFDLTLRQLYYQCVSRDMIANNPKEYKRLGAIINDARLAGLIDWDHITDRTRNLHSLANWASPQSIINVCAEQFRTDKWRDQKFRPEVWIEKEALAGVFERICDELQVPFFACRGYTSQSEMWTAGQRLRRYKKMGQTPVIFHFGDHDPSGVDMTRDIIDRLHLFMGGLGVERLALNMDQIEEYGPPPNPAKITDSRAEAYIAQFGDESWELDALDPTTLAELVRVAVTNIRDDAKWTKLEESEEEDRRLLREVSEKWEDLTEGL